jgi:F-type H+-transporting ATPase subunit b
VNLIPDLTIFIQIAIFLVVFFGLRRLVFEPFQKMLAERDARTVQAERSAEAMIAAAHADRARYEEAVREQRANLAREAEAARHEAMQAANREIAAARAEIARELAAHRAAVAAEVDGARRALAAQADRIADEMLQRVIDGERR